MSISQYILYVRYIGFGGHFLLLQNCMLNFRVCGRFSQKSSNNKKYLSLHIKSHCVWWRSGFWEKVWAKAYFTTSGVTVLVSPLTMSLTGAGLGVVVVSL